MKEYASYKILGGRVTLLGEVSIDEQDWWIGQLYIRVNNTDTLVYDFNNEESQENAWEELNRAAEKQIDFGFQRNK